MHPTCVSHISGHTCSGLEVVRFLVSLIPDHVYPSGGLSLEEFLVLLLVPDASFLRWMFSDAVLT